jgi:hypothetical protein
MLIYSKQKSNSYFGTTVANLLFRKNQAASMGWWMDGAKDISCCLFFLIEINFFY